MPLSQPIQDYLESLGTSVSQQGIAGRRFQPASATLAASVIGGIGRGMEMKRALEEARRLRDQQRAFEAKTGIPYDLFSKLGTEAQVQILQNSGKIEEPGSQPIPMLGGQSILDVQQRGLPGISYHPLGPTPSGEPLPSIERPPMSPGMKPGTKEWQSAFEANQGYETPISPQDQALIESRRAQAEADRERTKLMRTYGTTSGRPTTQKAPPRLTRWQELRIAGWMQQNPGSTPEQAVLALSEPLPGVYKGDFGSTQYVLRDGTITDSWEAGAHIAMYDKRTGDLFPYRVSPKAPPPPADSSGTDSTGVNPKLGF